MWALYKFRLMSKQHIQMPSTVHWRLCKATPTLGGDFWRRLVEAQNFAIRRNLAFEGWNQYTNYASLFSSVYIKYAAVLCLHANLQCSFSLLQGHLGERPCSKMAAIWLQWIFHNFLQIDDKQWQAEKKTLIIANLPLTSIHLKWETFFHVSIAFTFNLLFLNGQINQG